MEVNKCRRLLRGEMAVSAKCRWEYRGEGHRSIVVADVNNRRVYRMIKRPCCPLTNSMTVEDRLQVQRRELHQLQLIVDYVTNVMSPLMNPAFVTPPLLVDVAGNTMSEVGKTIESMRPARRKNKEVNPVSRSALALPDLCFLPSSHPTKPLPPSISIEIKPKRGFIPTSPHIAKEHQIKLEVCKYCLHSSLKVDRGMWTHASRYCPIDLFSGNVNRMKHALCCLMDTPRNNFRICKNGLEICGELTFEDLSEQLQGFLSSESFVEQNGVSERRYLSDFMDLIIGALMWVPPSDRQKSHRISEEVPPVQHCANSSYTPSHSHNSGEKAGLPPGCIMDSILRLQRLDDLDIERIILLYKQLKQHIKDHPEDSEKWELDGPYSEGSWKLHQNASSPKSIVQKIKEFLMSMTVQDCSIMISLQPVDGSEADNRYVANNPDHTLMDVHGQMYKFAVGTIDLDPKPFDKIPKYFHLDLDIVEAYKKTHVIARDSHSENS